MLWHSLTLFLNKDITDVEEMKPGLLSQIKEWFRVYKLAEGKEVNSFALNGEYQNRQYTEALIADCYERVFDILPRMFAEHEKELKNNQVKKGPQRGRRPRVPHIY